MSPFNQPKGMVAYGDMKVMLNICQILKKRDRNNMVKLYWND